MKTHMQKMELDLKLLDLKNNVESETGTHGASMWSKKQKNEFNGGVYKLE